MPPGAPVRPAAVAMPQPHRADRLLAAIRVALVIALTALVLASATLAHVLSFEATCAFAVETAAFPPELVWSAPLLVESFTASSQVETTSTKVSTRFLWWVVSVTGGWRRQAPRPAAGRRPQANQQATNHRIPLDAAIGSRHADLS